MVSNILKSSLVFQKWHVETFCECLVVKYTKYSEDRNDQGKYVSSD